MRTAKRVFRLTVCAVMLIILAVWGYNAALRYLYPMRTAWRRNLCMP